MLWHRTVDICYLNSLMFCSDKIFTCVLIQEHFYDAASSTGYISWHRKAVQRKIHHGSSTPPNRLTGVFLRGLTLQRTVNAVSQLDEDACKEAMSLLNQTTDNSVIFQKMKETFQLHQKLVNDPSKSGDILSTFPRFLHIKGLVSFNLFNGFELWGSSASAYSILS